jgi:hypothetical protein
MQDMLGVLSTMLAHCFTCLQAPSAIRAAANCFTSLLASQSDNNVKLIVLDRLAELKAKHKDVMSEVRALEPDIGTGSGLGAAQCHL